MKNQAPIAPLVLSVSLSCSLLGCFAETPEELATDPQALSKCPYWGCGENSPRMGPWDFHELNEDGRPNNEGVALVGLVKDGVWYRADVIESHLEGLAAGLPALKGTDLAGASLVVDAPDGQYEIEIKHVSTSTPFWVAPGAPIETYELYYTNVGAGSYHLPLCKNPPDRIDGEGGGHVWKYELEAMLFTGNRYDAGHKTVSAASYADAGAWFNIACAGSALAKLHLNRHTVAGAIPGYTTSWAQQQALLKMYVSDVCDTGDAFTRMGTPLHWENEMGWMELTGTEQSYEGLWNEHGALCLDHHRLEADPVMAAAIAAACPGVPPCSSIPDFPKVGAGGSYIVTANP